MHIDQARAIINASTGANPPPYADWVTAGQVIHRYYSDHPTLMRPSRLTHDAATGATAFEREARHVRAHGLHVDQAVMTHDSKPRRGAPTKAKLSNDLATTVGMMRLLRAMISTRKREYDEAATRRVMQLPGKASAYRVASDADGSTWVEEFAGSQTARKLEDPGPDLMSASRSNTMPGSRPGEAGHVGFAGATNDLERHRAATAARARGAAFAAQFNAAQRQRHGG